MAHLSRRHLSALATLLARLAGLAVLPAAAQPPVGTVVRAARVSPDVATSTLGLTLNDPALAPGKTPTLGMTVANPGGGPLVDFHFLIVLPDGTAAVAAGPGAAARLGSLANLRTLPLARPTSARP